MEVGSASLTVPDVSRATRLSVGQWHGCSFELQQKVGARLAFEAKMRSTLHVAPGRRTNEPDQRSVAPTLPALLTPAEVAAWLKTTISAVYAKAERGTLPGATRLGRRLYFLRSELVEFVEQGRVSQSGGPGGGT